MTQTWSLNNMLPTNQCIIKEIRGNLKTYLEKNEKENKTKQNYETIKSVLRWKFIAIQFYSSKQ